MTLRRCTWPRTELDTAYHDTEWGVPVHTDGKLFELLTLEGAQAGLSWSIILRKREAYRRAFAEFDAERVARFTPSRLERLLRDPGIVRNRLKIESTVTNARAFLRVQKEDGSFSAYVWSFVDGRPQVSQRRALGDLPTRSAVSDAMSASLKKRGFRFVGSTICYAFMQAAGLVNDHLVDCFRFRELAEAPDESRRARA
jgi:DNA-3-methyladenine glycosylase I